MSSDFMRRLAAPLYEVSAIPEHVIWRLTRNGRLAEARVRVVPIGDGRPEFRITSSTQPPAHGLPLGPSPFLQAQE